MVSLHRYLLGLLFAVIVVDVAIAANPPLMVTPGQFSVSSTGAATYNIPIAVPPGTSGVAPALSLTYSSQNGDGFVGLGWALNGLSSVTRCPRTLAQDTVHGSVNYDSNDQFCLDGQRLISTGTTSTLCASGTGTVYHTEVESFSRIISCGSSGSGPAYFKVWTKAGQIMEFGNTTDSAVLVVSTGTSTIPSGTIREWLVDRVSDVVTNYFTVTYNCASGPSCTDRTVNGEAYPIAINYTGNSNAGVSPYNSVQFTYASRTDVVPVYQAGGVVETTVVLNHVKTCTVTTIPCPSGNLVTDYQLGYRAGTNVLHSHLTSVTQCDNASHCLPQMTFGWQGITSIDLTTSTYSVTPGYSILPGDWNADGLTDFSFISLTCAPTYPVYLGQGSFGFSLSSTIVLNTGMPSTPFCDPATIVGTVFAPDGTSNQIIEQTQYVSGPPYAVYWAVFVSSAGAISLANTTIPSLNFSAGDFNGDGIPDYFSVQYPPLTGVVYLGSTGSGFSPDGGRSISGSGAVGDLRIADFDGDGCTDVLSEGSPNSYLYYAWHCNPAATTGTLPNLVGNITGDFNGDGKTDLIETGGSDQGLWLSTGTGFVKATSSLPGVIKAVGDWNGDGKADLVVDNGTDFVLYLSTGTGFVQALDQYGNPVTLSGHNLGSGGDFPIVADWDNNGNSDVLVHYPTAAPGSYDTFNLVNYSPELMTSVSNGVGSTTLIAYDRINNAASPFYAKGSGTYPTQDMIGPQYVVREVDASNGLGTCVPAPSHTNCYWTTYTYTGAQKDLRGRGFLGFSEISATDQQTNIVETTDYVTSCYSISGTCYGFPYTGLITKQTRKKIGNTHYLSEVDNTYRDDSSHCWYSIAPPTGVYQPCLIETVTSGYDLNDTAQLPTTTTDYTYGDYGNATGVNVTVAYGGSTSSTKNTTNTYSNDPANWFLGRLTATSVNSVVGSSNMTRQSSFAYSPSTGLLTQEAIEPGMSTCNNSGADPCELDTSYTYDAFGHRVITTLSHGTTILSTSFAFYSANGQFMTSVANALGQYEFWTYDARFGAPASHTGPNNLPTSWTYDTFGRMTNETRPDNTQANISYAYCNGTCPTYGQFYSRTNIVGPSGIGSPQIGPTSYAFYDMLSRIVANDTQGFDGSNIRVATVYDTSLRVQETSRPYFAASASPHWTQYTYDNLGRVLTATFPDSSVTNYCYKGLISWITNNAGQTIETKSNPQGLKASVTTGTSSGTLPCGTDGSGSNPTTNYVYDAFSDLLTVTDPLSNVITNSFDIRGNKYRSQDPDMGTWIYTYDVLAELISQTDANSQTTTLTYDALGRPLTRTESGLYSAWTYGTSAADHNVSQVVEAKACPTSACTSIISDRTYLFDGKGRESSYVLHTPTDYFAYGTDYNSTNGQINSVTFPSGYKVYRSYNGTGFLTQLYEQIGPAGQTAPITTINARDAELHLTSQTAANGVNTTQSFDANTGLIQNQKAAVVGGTPGSVANFTYNFDTIGNLTYRDDPNGGYAEFFCYDSLNRVTHYNFGSGCTGTGSTTVGYDAIGNITTKSDTGNYSYGGSRPHAISIITGTVDGLVNPNYSYDGNGNLTCVSSGSSCGGTVARQVTLTSFNMAATLAQGPTSMSLTYDDQHQRLQQTTTTSSGVATTVYVNDAASGAMSERRTDTTSSIPTFTDYFTIDGQIVAQRNVRYAGSPSWTLTPAGCTPTNLSPCVPSLWNSFYWGDADANKLTKAWNGFSWGAGTFGWSPQAWLNFKWRLTGDPSGAPWSGTASIGWSYFNLDHLGSVAVITDGGGNVVQRLAYDAWGKPRGSAACGTMNSPITTRGFTNQEEMPTPCLVNLNARIYDASIGKFLAPDSVIPDPYDGQSFNRYTYVRNNPLSFTDPTGHFYNSTNADDPNVNHCDFSSFCSSIVLFPSENDILRSLTQYINQVTAAFNAGFNNAVQQNLNQSQQTATGDNSAAQGAVAKSNQTVGGGSAAGQFAQGWARTPFDYSSGGTEYVGNNYTPIIRSSSTPPALYGPLVNQGGFNNGVYYPDTPPDRLIVATGTLGAGPVYTGPTFGNGPTWGRPNVYFPAGRINTGKFGDVVTALRDADALVVLNGGGIPISNVPAIAVIPTSEVPGWATYTNPTTLQTVNVNIATGITVRWGGKSEAQIDIPSGLLIAPGVRYTGGVPETVHYSYKP
ncbi:MAG TPA: FG-GAP-like repeat-containing protein [Rhizomicrobium sp.]|nr:FG-GAP-like repeat-containing protein [Rhizomicrobium sp.]